jgi:hypothetical protein
MMELMHATEKHLGEFVERFGHLPTEQGRRQGIAFAPAQTAHQETATSPIFSNS